MENYKIIVDLVMYAGLPTLISLFLTERLKGKIKNNFDQKIESLKKQHSLEISKFETELNYLKLKENFKFTKLHEKRLEVLETIYKLLNDSLNSLNFYVLPNKMFSSELGLKEIEDKLLENFSDDQTKFVAYYSNNKIYLGYDIEELIDNYITESTKAFVDYYQVHYLKKETRNDNEEAFIRASVAYKKIPEKIIPIRKEIEKKFRELLEN